MRTAQFVPGILAVWMFGCGQADPASDAEQELRRAAAHEVWVIDQSNSPGLTHGGTLHVFEGARPGRRGAAGARRETIDLGAETSALCQLRTGSFPVRPHMVFFNSTYTHAVTSFVASGHVVIFDAQTRTPVECLQTTLGAGGARQAHAAFPAPDDSYILVANQNGKKLERIVTDYDAGTFSLDTAAALDLAGCITPNGLPCQVLGLRPDNAPICPIIAADSATAFVTLRGGGLFVVDATTSPMQIVGEYDSSTVHGNGCGGVELRGKMFVDSGGGTAANLHEFDVYEFPTTGYSPDNPPNTPSPVSIFSDHEGERDAHGLVGMKSERHLWVFDRATNVLEIFDVQRRTHTATIDLVTPGLTLDPSPDLGDISPDGQHVYATLRGINPLSGDPHVATGDSPGLAVLGVRAGGRSAEVLDVIRISNLDAAGIERADPHGLRVRRLRR